MSLRDNVAGDAVVLFLGDDVTLRQVARVVVGTVGDDAVCGAGVDSRQGLEVFFGGLVDVDRAPGFEAVDYSFGNSFAVTDG